MYTDILINITYWYILNRTSISDCLYKDDGENSVQQKTQNVWALVGVAHMCQSLTVSYTDSASQEHTGLEKTLQTMSCKIGVIGRGESDE